MKKFIFVSLFALALCADAWACISEAPTHNNYMFSVFRRESMDSPFREDINAYWKRYAGDMSDTSTDYYRWNRDKIDAAARSRGDVLMQRYMKLLDSYLQVCDEVSYDSWDYPTKEQLTKRKSTLNSIRNSATMAMKTGLRELNALMVMRANMMLGYDQANISFWNSTAQNLPKGVWREVARNIYARALLNTGKRIEACNIYAEQGDMQSIKWSMRNYRNLAGIQKIYLDDPNSPTLIYLVQDFVNNVQETLDQATGTGTDEDWIKTIDARVVYKADAMRFVDFAKNVVRSGKNEYPCLWKSAIGMIYYLFGMSEEAVAELDEAMAMDGTPRMKDNARCIRLLASTGCNMFSPSYSAYLLKEMQRLDELIRDERGTSDIYPNHYTDVKERVVYNALVPKCMATGRVNMALALLGMMEENEQDFYTKGRHSQPDYVIEAIMRGTLTIRRGTNILLSWTQSVPTSWPVTSSISAWSSQTRLSSMSFRKYIPTKTITTTSSAQGIWPKAALPTPCLISRKCRSASCRSRTSAGIWPTENTAFRAGSTASCLTCPTPTAPERVSLKRI